MGKPESSKGYKNLTISSILMLIFSVVPIDDSYSQIYRFFRSREVGRFERWLWHFVAAKRKQLEPSSLFLKMKNGEFHKIYVLQIDAIFFLPGILRS